MRKEKQRAQGQWCFFLWGLGVGGIRNRGIYDGKVVFCVVVFVFVFVVCIFGFLEILDLVIYVGKVSFFELLFFV